MFQLDAILDPSARRALFGRVRLVGLFLLVFASVAAALSVGLRAVSASPDMVVLSPKLEHLKTNADRYDTVFLGTSRTFYHIVPDFVEAGAAQAGCRNYSVYNFGVFGLTGAEQDWLLEEVLALGAIRRVILEDPLPQPRDPGETTTQRGRFFHGPEDYAPAMSSIASYPESALKRVYRTGVLGIGALYDLSGVGRGAALAFPEATPSAPHVFDMIEDGFEALGSKMTPGIQARRDEFLAQPERFEEALDLYGRTSPNIEARADYMSAKLDRVEAAGKSAALYISPDLLELDRTAQVGFSVAERSPQATVLNFNRPDAYPELFERDVWYDFSHLSRAGAEQLSRKVGAELCAAQTSSGEGALHAVR